MLPSIIYLFKILCLFFLIACNPSNAFNNNFDEIFWHNFQNVFFKTGFDKLLLNRIESKTVQPRIPNGYNDTKCIEQLIQLQEEFKASRMWALRGKIIALNEIKRKVPNFPRF